MNVEKVFRFMAVFSTAGEDLLNSLVPTGLPKREPTPTPNN
jgi:hypothetical protein